MQGGTLASLVIALGLNNRALLEGLATSEEAAKRLGDTAESEGSRVESSMGRSGSSFGGVASAVLASTAIVAGGLVAAGGEAIHMAADFQESMTQLVTGAGESEQNIGAVSSGILAMAGQVGESTQQLSQGMFMIESAGYHGAAGLDVLRAAAEGAKVGNADLGTTADAVTTVLKDYHMGAGQASDATNFLVSVVSQGKTHMQDLAGSLAAILPTASALGVPLAQVGGAIATLTSRGVPAADAATYLRSTMSALAAETPKGAKALADVGLTSQQVGDTLTHQGLLPAIQMIQDALAKKFPAGSAAYFAALKDITGGTRGLGAALQLSGQNLGDFATATQNVAAQVAGGHGAVLGWDKVQGDFNQSLDRFKGGAEAAAIGVGNKLLPMVQNFMNNVLIPNLPKIEDLANKFLDVANAVGNVLGPHLDVIGPVVLGLVAGFVAFKTAMAVQAAIEGVSTAMGIMSGALALLTTGEASAATAADAMAIGELAALAPILLIVAAIAVLVVGIVLLVTHWKQVTDWLGKVWAAFTKLQIVKDIVGWFNTMKDGVLKLVGELVSWFQKQWAEFVADPPRKIGEMVGAIIVFFVTLPIRIQAIIDQIIAKVVGWGGQLVSWAKKAIPDFVGQVVTFFSDLPGKMLDLGGQIVHGIWNGITGLAGWLGKQVAGFAGGIVDGMKGALGIKSPSTIFASVVGVNIVKGIAAGIAGTPDAHLAMSRLAGSLATGAGGPTGSYPAMSSPSTAPGGAGAVGRGITITVNNPTPEPASTSINRELRKVSYLQRMPV